MAKAQLKLLIFLITAGLALGCVATAYWIYEKVLLREQKVQRDIANLRSSGHAPVDPGARRFDAAVDLIRQGQIDNGRDALYKLLQQFPESPTCAEAKRIIGEINMDAVFSPNQMVGKKDYIVQPGDSLLLIATKNNTTIDMIVRMNNLVSTTLHPGDHLLVTPLDFDVVVDVSARTVTLLRKDRFFKQYDAFRVELPSGLRVPVEMEIGGKSALIDGKPVLATDARYAQAEKWLPGTKPGVLFRAIPVARAVPVDAPAPKDAGAAAGEDDAATGGILLAPEDLEEIFAILRKGSKLSIVR